MALGAECNNKETQFRWEEAGEQDPGEHQGSLREGKRRREEEKEEDAV